MEMHTEGKSGVGTYLALSDRLRGTWSSTKHQIAAIERRLEVVERLARASLESMPVHLREAWGRAAGGVGRGFDFASGEDLRQLAARVDELAQRVEKLAHERAPKSSGRVAKLPSK